MKSIYLARILHVFIAKNDDSRSYMGRFFVTYVEKFHRGERSMLLTLSMDMFCR